MLKRFFVDENNIDTIDMEEETQSESDLTSFWQPPKDSTGNEQTEMGSNKLMLNTFKRHLKQHNKLVDKYRHQYVSDIVHVIKNHYKTLEAKYEQLAYADDYGYVKLDAFWPEFEYFVENVLNRETPPFFYDPCIDADPKLWQSYKKLQKEYFDISDVSDELRNQAKAEAAYTWWWPSFFCFSIKIKKIGEVTQGGPESNKLETTITLTTVEDAVAEKERIFLLDDEFGAIDRKIAGIAFSVFDYIRITQNALDDAIFQATGVKKKRIVPNDPLEYEKYVSVCLKDLGFKVRTTKASGDQGADVLAEKNGVSFAIQCKMYSKPVGNKAVQEANAGRDFYKCDYGVVVSNAGFTKSAKQAANACKIILLNESQLDKLLKYLPGGDSGK